MNKFCVLAFISCLCYQLPAQAAVYKCEKDGVTTFSQTPCGQDAQTTDYTTVGQERQAKPAVVVKKDHNEVDRYIQQRQLKRQIQKVIKKKEDKIAQRNSEMNAIRDKQMTAKNNDVAGASYLQSLAQEMAAVVEAYDTEIKSLDQELAQLQQQLSKIEPD
ncbi:DUF4124 domain-containing protein [Rheinheimera sp.]|uniref:DUF4124 domain-containing protein n=1 Tax=Rheinheimera sp. TaxID=1869214 RepID=UPI0027B8FC6A|nr:DUF4124 domain-containing protein [Rheinheimera sp.]